MSTNASATAAQENNENAEVAGPDKLVVWMFILCFAAMGLVMLADLIAGALWR